MSMCPKTNADHVNDPGLTPRLPLELIYAIMGHLRLRNGFDLERQALAACTLVCKAWTHPARFHLFSQLTVEPEHDLEELLDSVSAGIPFVRHLYLYGPQSWNVNFPLLVGFQSITALSLSNLDTQLLDANAESAFFNNFSTLVVLRLLDVQYASVTHLVRSICAFPRLRTLVVDVEDTLPVDFEHDLPPPTAFRLPSTLIELDLCAPYMDKVLQWFLSLPDLPALHSVYLHRIWENDLDVTKQFLVALEDSLECLFLSTEITDEPNWPFDLSRHTKLRSVQFGLFTTGTDPPPDHTRWVTQTLSRISSVHMTDVQFDLTVNIDHHHDRSFLGWSEVDAVLQRAPFSNLTELSISFIVENWQCRDLMFRAVRLPAQVAGELPLCKARGILRVDYLEGRTWDSYL